LKQELKWEIREKLCIEKIKIKIVNVSISQYSKKIKLKFEFLTNALETLFNIYLFLNKKKNVKMCLCYENKCIFFVFWNLCIQFCKHWIFILTIKMWNNYVILNKFSYKKIKIILPKTISYYIFTYFTIEF
jgi:hypothetical protein